MDNGKIIALYKASLWGVCILLFPIFKIRQCVFSSGLPVRDWLDGHYNQQQNEISLTIQSLFLM